VGAVVAVDTWELSVKTSLKVLDTREKLNSVLRSEISEKNCELNSAGNWDKLTGPGVCEGRRCFFHGNLSSQIGVSMNC
jgi:hypothetical protein